MVHAVRRRRRPEQSDDEQEGGAESRPHLSDPGFHDSGRRESPTAFAGHARTHGAPRVVFSHLVPDALGRVSAG